MSQKVWRVEIDYAACGLDQPDQLATLTSYRLDRNEDTFVHRVLPAVIICPGGGYEFVSPREAAPVAQAFNAKGIHAFVLDYSVKTVRFPGALLELSKSVAYVREHAEEWNIDPNRIAVCGFSAGGHLAASLGVYWKELYLRRALGYDREEHRPNALILSYPVISGKKALVHEGSRFHLMGEEDPDDLFSLEDYVSEATPPTFLWHTADDTCVPVGNSLAFAAALTRQKILYELHVYPYGEHGLSLANEVTACDPCQVVPECQAWLPDAARFIHNL